MKNLWYIIGILALLVAIAILVRGRRPSPVPVESVTPTPVATPEPTPSPTPKPAAKRRTPTPAPTPSYNEVAGQYAGNRIQFDVFCQVFPIETVFTDGTQVMLDNRSPDDRVVAIGDIQHGLRAYGWKVVTMTAAQLPVTLAVDCGTAKNVGKVVIEPLPTPAPEPLPTPASPSEPVASASATYSPEPTPTP